MIFKYYSRRQNSIRAWILSLKTNLNLKSHLNLDTIYSMYMYYILLLQWVLVLVLGVKMNPQLKCTYSEAKIIGIKIYFINSKPRSVMSNSGKLFISFRNVV